MSDSSPQPQTKSPTEADQKQLAAILKKANTGDKPAIEELRSFLDANPHVWRQLGNLANSAERAWIELIAGDNRLAGESILREITRIRTEMVGGNPTAVEQMLADQVVVTMLESRYLETIASTQRRRKLTEASLLLRRLESAQKRHLTAIKSLAQMRRLMAIWESQPGLKIFGGQRETA